MSFEESVELKRTQVAQYGDIEDYENVVSQLAIVASVTIDNEIVKYQALPACGQIVQSLKNLRKELAKVHYTAGVLQMVKKGGNFEHQQIPESEWRVPV